MNKSLLVEKLEELNFIDLAFKVEQLQIVTLKQVDRYLSKHSNKHVKVYSDEKIKPYLTAADLCREFGMIEG